MLRKSAFILITLLCSMVTQVFALELGTGSIESDSNQSLRARIEILQLGDTRWQDVTVQMASAEEFERFNIERVPLLTNIRLSVESTTQGNYVTLTSDQVVTESNLSFVLETRWPNGRSLSIHTLLLDLPVFQDDQMEEVRAPISTVLEPSQDAQPTVTQPFTNPDLAILSSIASRVRPDTSVSIEQTMLAIQELNPNIFVDDNTNQIRSGQVLRVPTLGQIQAIDPRETINEVALQNQQAVDQQPLASSAQEEPEETDQPQGRLSVVTEEADAADAQSAAGGINEGASPDLDQRIAFLENQLALRQEDADRARIEREELDLRLANLESQIDGAQEIIRLQDLQLAQLQDQLAAAAAAQAAVEAQAAAAIASIEVEVATDQQPSSDNVLLNNVMSILTGNTTVMIIGAALVILLLVLLLLRRNKVTGSDNKNLDELAEKEFPSDVETLDEDTAVFDDRGHDTELGEFIDDGGNAAESEDDLDDLGFLSDNDEVEIESVDEIEEVDLLPNNDETATKLELAYAYQKMGDIEGSKEILQEVIKEGTDEQIKEAAQLMASLDKPSE